jgi:hypothetical protein
VFAILVVSAVSLAGGSGPEAGKTTGDPPRLFTTSSGCVACHNGLTDPAGRDISIGTDWRGSMMANSARDPYWQATVRRESLDHPDAVAAIEGECSICHMPMARTTAHAGGGTGRIFAHLPAGEHEDEMSVLAADGISCTVCHQIKPDNFGKRSSFVGGFLVDTGTAWGKRSVFGPFDVDAGRTRIMSSSSELEPKKGEHIRESALCGTCHTLYTHALGPGSEGAGEFPEQVPYLEWLHSRYPSSKSCQACHMGPIDGAVDISSVWGTPREGAMQHVFRGGNFFVPRLLNRHRGDLGTEALPQELQATSERTVAHLELSSARVGLPEVRFDGERLDVTVCVHNLAGHKLPSAYPSRRVWIRLQVADASGAKVFESGALRPDGSIQGNDNDADPARYEPHHAKIGSPDQVQIYEPILGTPAGKVTTGLLYATRYLKDNRLLPEGFDKATAGRDIEVAGAARDDADFKGGGDKVVYSLTPGGAGAPYTVTADLVYQTIGYRWAHNLAAYDADEPRRFVGYYEAAADSSAVVLATARATAERPPAGSDARPVIPDPPVE